MYRAFFLWHHAKEISVAYFLAHECYKKVPSNAQTPTITVTVILLTGRQAQVGVLSPAHVHLLDSTTEERILKGKYQLAFARRILPWINLTL
jgi:sRNA-binding carbon storage regulator CsrA